MTIPSGTAGAQLVEEFFSRLQGLPCWGVSNGFGSWIDLEFGRPRLEVWRARETSRGWQRHVHVGGEHSLWIEMCDWVLTFDGRRVLHSESLRTRMPPVLRRLDGRVLTGVRIGLRPLRTTLTFEFGAELALRRCRGRAGTTASGC